jgi:hypothetical protein
VVYVECAGLVCGVACALCVLRVGYLWLFGLYCFGAYGYIDLQRALRCVGISWDFWIAIYLCGTFASSAVPRSSFCSVAFLWLELVSGLELFCPLLFLWGLR